jgi:peptidoglycan/LPS O-acetylase OafA/YrhL
MNTLGLTLTYVGYGILLILFVKSESNFRSVSDSGWYNFLAKPLAFVGYYSYSIYLWHIPFLAYIIEPLLISINEVIGFLIYFFGSIIVGTIISRIVEVPVLKFRDKKFPVLSKLKTML